MTLLHVKCKYPIIFHLPMLLKSLFKSHITFFINVFHSLFFYNLSFLYNNAIRFLFNRLNRDKPDQLYLNNKQTKEISHWRHEKPVVLYIHGFTESTNKAEGESGFAIRDCKFKESVVKTF